MRLYLQDKGEDISLSEEAGHSREPDLGLVVNSHDAPFFRVILLRLS